MIFVRRVLSLLHPSQEALWNFNAKIVASILHKNLVYTNILMVFITKSSTSVTSVAENTPAMEHCTLTSSLLMKTRNIPAHIVIIKLPGRIILYNTNSHSTKV